MSMGIGRITESKTSESSAHPKTAKTRSYESLVPAGALLGPAGLGLALGVVSSLIVSFGDKLFSAKASMNDYQKVVSEAKDEFVKMFASLSQAQNNIDLVKSGLVSQQSALEQYNSTIGKVAGSANTWAEAEQCRSNCAC